MRTNDFSPTPAGGDGGRRGARDLDALLHPAQAFEHPMKVVDDSDLTLAEKRAILASWASDARAVEATPTLRQPPGAGRTIGFEDVMDALRALDREGERPRPHYRRVLAQRRPRGVRAQAAVASRPRSGVRARLTGRRYPARATSRWRLCGRRASR